MEDRRLVGKVAVVTGGSRGIGAAIAERLAREGADVAITYVSDAAAAGRVVEQIRAAKTRGLACRADAGDAAAVHSAIATVAEQFGRIDILVNNAGILRYGTIDNLSLEDFDRSFAVNVRGAFVAVQTARPHMSDGGRIINIGSVGAVRCPVEGSAAYTTTKAALEGMTRALARDLGPAGITVNIIHPGPIETDMNPAAGPLTEMMRNMLAVPFFGAGGDIASTVAFLAGPEARFLTGASLMVDGGQSL